jgi:hypothetical protein
MTEDLERERYFPEVIPPTTEHDLKTAAEQADSAIGRLETHC